MRVPGNPSPCPDWGGETENGERKMALGQGPAFRAIRVRDTEARQSAALERRSIGTPCGRSMYFPIIAL